MDSGDSDNKIILIKQEVESNEINETVDSANIKFEQEDAIYGIQCDGIKVEPNLNLKHQDESESEMFNPEYVWVDSKGEKAWKAESEKIDAIGSNSSQITEELGNIESNTNAETTYDPELHRMKVELTDENWCSTVIDGDVLVKTEVKSEKLEDEAYMVPKFEQMDTLDLNEEVDIKPDGDPITTSDSDCAVKNKAVGKENLQARRKTEEEFICLYCSDTFRRKCHLVQHLARSCLVQIGARIKSAAFKNITTKRSVTTSVVLCQHCNASFNRAQTRDDHIIKKHPDFIASVRSKIHECVDCEFKTTKKSDLDKHVLRHLDEASSYKRISCQHCGGTYRGKRNLDYHIIEKHPDFIASVTSKIFKCHHCAYKTVIKVKLVKHMSMHSGAGSSGELMSCEHCTATFKVEKSLDEHVVKKHPDFISSVTRNILSCSYCTYKTIFKRNFNEHVSFHATVKPNTCEHCKATFKIKRSLDDHIIKKHPKFATTVTCKVHFCNKCTFRTTLKSSLDKHMFIKHSDAASCSKNACQHCNATFTSKLLRDEHIIKNHLDYLSSVTRKIYECPYCPYKTAIRHNIENRHISTHFYSK